MILSVIRTIPKWRKVTNPEIEGQDPRHDVCMYVSCIFLRTRRHRKERCQPIIPSYIVRCTCSDVVQFISAATIYTPCNRLVTLYIFHLHKSLPCSDLFSSSPCALSLLRHLLLSIMPLVSFWYFNRSDRTRFCLASSTTTTTKTADFLSCSFIVALSEYTTLTLDHFLDGPFKSFYFFPTFYQILFQHYRLLLHEKHLSWTWWKMYTLWLTFLHK